MAMEKLIAGCAAMGLDAMEGIDPKYYPLMKKDGLKVSLCGSHSFKAGPVNPATVIFLFHSDEAEENAVYLFDDIYFSNDRNLLAKQLQRPTKESRLEVYAGYAGWAPGQLQAEIMQGGWTTVKATKKLLFKIDRASIWQKLSNKASQEWI